MDIEQDIIDEGYQTDIAEKSDDSFYKIILDASVADTYDRAVLEWYIIELTEDTGNVKPCICGEKSTRYKFTLENFLTGKRLFPVSQACIKKMHRDTLNQNANRFIEYQKFVNLILSETHITKQDLSVNIISILKDFQYIDEDEEAFLQKIYFRRRRMTAQHQKKYNDILRYKIIRPVIDNYMSYETPGRSKPIRGYVIPAEFRPSFLQHQYWIRQRKSKKAEWGECF